MLVTALCSVALCVCVCAGGNIDVSAGCTAPTEHVVNL